MSVNVTIVDDNNITVAVTEEAGVNVSVADTPLPLDLYQKKITISATEPNNPVVDDLWLDIS